MISAIVITKNEEQNILDSLKALSFCDEIIVLDSSSSDRTPDLARQSGATVITVSDKMSFAEIRNIGMKKAKGSWMLFIDADERVSKSLAGNISKMISDTRYNSFFIKRRDHWWGKIITHGEVASAYHDGIIRLVKRGSGSWQGDVHELFVPTGTVGDIEGYIDHYPHQTITEFIYEINLYSSLRAEELFKQGIKSSLFQLVVYPFGKFIFTYFIKRGYLDGPQGFVYSFLMSFHSFLVRTKLYMMAV